MEAESFSNLCESCGSRGHQDLTHSVVETLHRFIIHTQETLSCPLLGYLKQIKNSSEKG